MMKVHVGLPAVATAAFLGLGLIATGANVRAAELSSGLKPGEEPPAFMVQDATGPMAGTGKLCYRCRYAANPVVAVFTHKLDNSVTTLIKQVDAQIEKNKDKRMKAFVVLLTDDPDKAEVELKQIADKNNIKNVPLTIFDGVLGPLDYKLSPKAETTVMMWVKSDVKVNYAFAGKVDAKAIQAIISDTGKILN
jgi:hypothetical protein